MEVKVMTVQEDEEKLIFSERAAWEEKQKDKLDQFKVGDIVEGKISGVVDFGCFVEFGQGLEGLVHISELAWQRIDNPRDVVKSGDKVKAKIINLDGSKISLSFRRLHDDPWKNVDEKYQLNDIVEGKVLKVNPFGVFVELDPEIHGLAHVSELSEKPVKDPTEIVKIGETRQWRIISMDPKEHRLGLSIKALETKPEVTEKETATEATPPAEPSPQTETEAT
ncbi:MAG: hypothetical protein A2429_01065 [Candidatus Veblenbacteria bacterium RIFOXYC1_FULL_42_9]|nr:MAG: hypothetical protein A2429_01065 [Candidatus Veblenbacteria bacterium RIFOXYC1_FULL_42_9]